MTTDPLLPQDPSTPADDSFRELLRRVVQSTPAPTNLLDGVLKAACGDVGRLPFPEPKWTPVAEPPLAARTGDDGTILHQFHTRDTGDSPGQEVRVILSAANGEQCLDVYVRPTAGRTNRLAAVWVRLDDIPTQVLVGLCRNGNTGDDIGSLSLTALAGDGAPALVTGIDETRVAVGDGSAFGPRDAAEITRMRVANLLERAVFDELLARRGGDV
jgi:hypothetical protein